MKLFGGETMLCNTNLSLALKNQLGKYEMLNFTIFQIKILEKQFENLNVNLINNSEISIKLKCPFCSKYHYYKFKINDFRNTKMFIGGCENLGLTIFFIGDFKKVSETIKRHNEIDNMVYAMI
jgi:hypothetical protein